MPLRTELEPWIAPSALYEMTLPNPERAESFCLSQQCLRPRMDNRKQLFLGNHGFLIVRLGPSQRTSSYASKTSGVVIL